MVICPKCSKEIDCLCTETTSTTGAYLDADGNLNLDDDLMRCAENNEFRCPECNEALFSPQEQSEAVEFLQQENPI